MRISACIFFATVIFLSGCQQYSPITKKTSHGEKFSHVPQSSAVFPPVLEKSFPIASTGGKIIRYVNDFPKMDEPLWRGIKSEEKENVQEEGNFVQRTNEPVKCFRPFLGEENVFTLSSHSQDLFLQPETFSRDQSACYEWLLVCEYYLYRYSLSLTPCCKAYFSFRK